MGWWAAVLVLPVVAACAGSEPAPEQVPPRPNLLLVTIDTLRADRLSAWGYPLETSPELDRLAASGVRFSLALSAAACTAPSHASIFTGVYPSFHSVGGYNGRYRLDDGALTLTESLAAAGYSTAAVVSNPVLARRLGLDQGFGSYDDELGDVEPNRPWKQQRAGTAIRKAVAAVAALEPPWFLWLHLQDPHGPYTPPPGAPEIGSRAAAESAADDLLQVGADHSGYGAIPRYQQLGAERRAAVYSDFYDREIAYADRQLGRFFAALDEMGRLEDTLIAVTADHGEAMGEDGFWFAHGHSVGLDQVHVPLVLAGGGRGDELPAGTVIDAPVSHVALYATLLEAAGLEAGPAPGRVPSLWSLLGGAAPQPVFVESLNQVGVAAGGSFLRRDRVAEDDAAFWNGPNPTTGGFWKPLGTSWRSLDAGPGAADPAPPGSLVAVLDRFQQRVDQAAAEQARRRSAGPGGGPTQPPDEEELRRLRALGYAG